MASPIQYLVLNAAGAPIGAGSSPDGTLPPATATNSYVICTATEAQNWSLCTVENDVVTQGTPPASTLAQQAEALLAEGIVITSTGSAAALNGTYSTTAAAQSNAASIASYVNINGKFPGNSTSTLTYADSSGKPHVFPSTAEFMAFYTAAGNFVADCEDVIFGLSTMLPSNAATIP
jgi:hypothetical protein